MKLQIHFSAGVVNSRNLFEANRTPSRKRNSDLNADGLNAD